MVGGLWLNGMGDDMEPPRPRQGAGQVDQSMKIRDLEHQIARINLLNQALWELLRERAKMTDNDLLAKIKEVDLRDGIEDGRMTVTPLECPSCGRVSSSKHWKCLYCGQLFEKPAMG
ncbi:MAG: hypothetical protein RBU21_00755 [FCB group bacterium]|jgi:hypothetical protein|nr:hypothetical protein [FCB group bacterium]